MRLAAQGQARTQQLAAAKGQGEQLLGRTHGPNLTAAEGELHLYTLEKAYWSYRLDVWTCRRMDVRAQVSAHLRRLYVCASTRPQRSLNRPTQSRELSPKTKKCGLSNSAFVL